MDIRPIEEPDREVLESMMDDFQDELIEMDPHRRLVREAGYGRHLVQAMLDDAAAHEGRALVAIDGKRIVGFATGAVRLPDKLDRLSVVPFRNGDVTELYVAPGARNEGVGRALVDALEEHFRGRHCDAVYIEVFAPNALARSFYAGLGYEERTTWVFKKLV